MKIYIDTSRLIDLLERSDPVSPEALCSLFQSNGHELVLSREIVCEISAPLLNRTTKTNVSRILNQLERFPVAYICHPIALELKESAAAFLGDRNYREIDPFRRRFDYILEQVNQEPATHDFIALGLAETVFNLWCTTPRLLEPLHRHDRRWADLLVLNRAMAKQPGIAAHFPVTLKRDFKHYSLVHPDEFSRFAQWVLAEASRCPSEKLSFALYHEILRNTRDRGQQGDISDVLHLAHLPYVDLMVMERRMADYAVRACKLMGLPYGDRILTRSKDMLDRL